MKSAAPATTSQALSRLAGGVALAITLLPPLGYYLVQRQGIVHSVGSDARVQAIAAGTAIARHPGASTDARARLIEAVEAMRQADHASLILDPAGRVLGQSGPQAQWPSIEREQTFYELGAPAGRVRVAASLTETLFETSLVFAFSALLGFIVYVPLHRMPKRALQRAAESLMHGRLDRSLVDGLSEGVILSNDRLEVITANRSAEAFPGTAQPIVAGARLTDCLRGVERADGAPFAVNEWPMVRCLESGQPEGPVVMRLRTGDGGEVLLSVKAQPIRHGERDAHRAAVTSIENITRQRHVADRLALTERAFQSSRDAILITDANATILSTNEAFASLTGYTSEEVIGRKPSLLRSGRHDDAFYRELWTRLLATGAWSGEIWNRRKGGAIFPAWLSISAVSDANGQVTHYVGTSFDMSERQEAEERVRHLAQHDALTGLPNRTYLRETLGQALSAARRHGWRVGIYFIDLDHFKLINDTMGHEVGDLVLGEVAQRLKTMLRTEDTVGRLAGDQFLAITPTVASEAALVTVAENILRALGAPFKHKDQEFFLTTSIGVVAFPDDGADVDALLSNADTAMYAAKADGRANFKFFTAAMNETGRDQLETAHAVRVGLEQDEFVLYYQPQVDTRDPTRILGAEALIRWQHPQRGLVPPGLFIPVIEGSRLIIEMGNWVLEKALRQARHWREQGLDTCISINVSPLQFRQPNFVADLRAAAERHDFVQESIRLEVTEGLMLTEPEATIEKMHEIRKLGYRLSLDDFGTGYSSLAYLARFPFDELKVDRSFVCRVTEDRTSVAIIDAVITLAHALGLYVVGEGVETEEEAAILRRLGCDQIQGYLYGRPMPAADFERRLRAMADAAPAATPAIP